MQVVRAVALWEELGVRAATHSVWLLVQKTSNNFAATTPPLRCAHLRISTSMVSDASGSLSVSLAVRARLRHLATLPVAFWLLHIVLAQPFSMNRKQNSTQKVALRGPQRHSPASLAGRPAPAVYYQRSLPCYVVENALLSAYACVPYVFSYYCFSFPSLFLDTLVLDNSFT